MKAKVKIVDVFTITGRGNVIVATILEGSLNKGDMIIIGDKTREIQGVEMFATIGSIDVTSKEYSERINTDVGLLVGTLDTKEQLLRFKDQEVLIIEPFTDDLKEKIHQVEQKLVKLQTDYSEYISTGISYAMSDTVDDKCIEIKYWKTFLEFLKR